MQKWYPKLRLRYPLSWLPLPLAAEMESLNLAHTFLTISVQGSFKEWSLGCVKCAPAARGGQNAGITQPVDQGIITL